jgi:hypothetical protein
MHVEKQEVGKILLTGLLTRQVRYTGYYFAELH